MDIIKGQKFLRMCDVYISKQEHVPFEGIINSSKWIDIDSHNFDNFDNPKVVYANSSLLQNKPNLIKSNFRQKLKLFKNPFYLILHNSDSNFQTFESDILEIENLIHVYTTNLNIRHHKVSPIPIGIANDIWKWGNDDVLNSVINLNVKKTNLLYCNFEIDGGLRPIDRVPCKKRMDELKIKMNPKKSFNDYLIDLKTHKYCLCPQGNGFDTHRFWEALYLKTIPVVRKTEMTVFFKKYFPIVLIDDWKDLEISFLYDNYEKINNWKNYQLLDMKNYIKKFIKII